MIEERKETSKKESVKERKNSSRKVRKKERTEIAKLIKSFLLISLLFILPFNLWSSQKERKNISSSRSTYTRVIPDQKWSTASMSGLMVPKLNRYNSSLFTCVSVRKRFNFDYVAFLIVSHKKP